MIKFLHAADFHLDSPFRALSPAQAARRRQEQRALLDELVELCNAEHCDLLLLAGDLFDSAAAWEDTMDKLSRSLRACRARVFIAPGNHDFFAPGSPYQWSKWPENVHIFEKNQIESVYLPELDTEIYGAAFTAPTAASLLEGFRVRDPGCHNLMVLHADAENPTSPYCPVSQAQIEASGLSYLALGHIHAASGPRIAGKTVYAWPGCPMGRGFDELGEKGVYLGSLDADGCTLEFRPLPGRRYVILTVPAGDDALTAVEAALPADTQNDIYRVILTGPSDGVDTRALHTALENRFFSLNLRDETTTKRDLWESCGEDTLKGLFLQELKTAMEGAANPGIYRLAAELGLCCMEGREVPEP